MSPLASIYTTVAVYNMHPQTHQKTINQYVLLKEIGRGFHAKVKLALDMNDNSNWAVKILHKSPKKRLQQLISLSQRNSKNYNNPHMEGILREIDILQHCSHPHIINLRETINDPNCSKIYLILEYMPGGEVKWQDEEFNADNRIIQPILSHSQSKSLFKDLVSGVFYLHQQNIIHRDLKPSNLLLTNDFRLKISDFGTSLFNSPESVAEFGKAVGSPAFIPPELCGISDEFSDFDNLPDIEPFAIDIWTMGVTLYCFIYGQIPFPGESEFEVFHAINNSSVIFHPHIPIENSLKDLISKMLDKNPHNRVKLNQIINHPWITNEMDTLERSLWPHTTSLEIPKKLRRSFLNRVGSSFTEFTNKILNYTNSNSQLNQKPSTKRYFSMPNLRIKSPISNVIHDSGHIPIECNSSPPIIPYMPSAVETRVKTIKENQKREELNSIVTDLNDQNWESWGPDEYGSEFKHESSI